MSKIFHYRKKLKKYKTKYWWKRKRRKERRYRGIQREKLKKENQLMWEERKGKNQTEFNCNRKKSYDELMLLI